MRMKFWLKIVLIVVSSMAASAVMLWVSASSLAEFVCALPGFGVAWCAIIIFMGGGYWWNTRFPVAKG